MRTLLLLALLCTVSLSAQERILGLVEIAGLPGFEPLRAEQAGIPLHAEPSAESAVIAQLRAFDAIEFREHGYEERSATFYKSEIIGDVRWYQVRLAPSGQAGWISEENVGPVRLVDELLKDSLTYFADSWDRKLRLAAGKPETEFRVPFDIREPSVTIADRASIDGQPWLLVVVTEGICVEGDPAVLAAGWVPLYAADNSLNVWFYSRGC